MTNNRRFNQPLFECLLETAKEEVKMKYQCTAKLFYHQWYFTVEHETIRFHLPYIVSWNTSEGPKREEHEHTILV